MKAGPRKGNTARRPRRSPVRDRSAAHRTRASPGSAPSTPSTWCSTGGSKDRTTLTATAAHSFDEDRAGEPERDACTAAADSNGNRTLELALAHDLHPRAGQQVAALQLAKPAP